MERIIFKLLSSISIFIISGDLKDNLVKSEVSVTDFINLFICAKYSRLRRFFVDIIKKEY